MKIDRRFLTAIITLTLLFSMFPTSAQVSGYIGPEGELIDTDNSEGCSQEGGATILPSVAGGSCVEGVGETYDNQCQYAASDVYTALECPNTPPELAPIGNKVIVEEGTLAFSVNATDSDPTGDALTLSWESDAEAAGAAFTDNQGGTGSVEWVTVFGDAGTYYANFTVSDGRGGSDWENITITVREPGTSFSNTTAVGPAPLTVEFFVNSTDWFLVSEATFDNGAGGVGVSTSANQSFQVDYGVGTYTAWFNGTHDLDGPFTRSVVVNATNIAPVLNPIGDASTVTGKEVTIPVSATDDNGHLMQMALAETNMTGDPTFTDNGDGTGDFSWTPGVTDVGWYYANFTVDDGHGGMDFENITIEVQEPATSFETDSASGVYPLTVTFYLNATNPSVVADNATFDDGQGNNTDLGVFGSSNRTISVVYDEAGPYAATFAGSYPGEGTFSYTIPINVAERSTSLVPNVTSGLAPLAVAFHLNATDEAQVLDGATFDDGQGSVQNLTTFTNQTMDVVYDAPGVYTAWFNGTYTGEGGFSHPRTIEVMNQKPVLDEIGNPTITEGDTLEIHVNASDADGDGLTYDFLAMSIPSNEIQFPYNATTGGHDFSWTPDYQSAGTHYVNFTVRDPFGGTDSENVTITVNDFVNEIPEFRDITVNPVEEGHTLTFDVNTTDANGDPITLGIDSTNITEWDSFNDWGDGNGTFSWTPDYHSAGSYFVNFSASDNHGGINYTNVSIAVTPSTAENSPPTIALNGFPVIIDNVSTIEADQAFDIGVVASDEDGDALKLDIATDLPEDRGWNFVHNLKDDTGNFTWATTGADIGSYYVNFTVNDQNGTVIGKNITLEVIEPTGNIAPLLSPIGNQAVSVNHTLAFQVTADDGDDPLTFSMESNATDAGAEFYEESGDFAWVPPTENVGSYYANFTVMDPYGRSMSENITITVRPNAVPVLEEIEDLIQIQEGHTVMFDVNASDADDADLVFGITTNATGHSFDSNGAGNMTFAWTPGFGDAGTYFAEFSVRDMHSGEAAPQNITITVTDFINMVPELADVGNKSVEEGDTLIFTATAQDPDMHQTLVFDLVTNATGAELNRTSGVFSWSPAVGDAGSYFANITVNDGESTDWENITITVTEFVNAVPVLDSIGDRFVEAGDTLSFRVNASDDDGHALTFGSLTGNTNVTGHSFTDNASLGGKDFSWTPTASQVGTYFANFTVTDGNGGSDFERINITVRPSIAPVLGAIGDISVVEGQGYSKKLDVVDPGDEDRLTFTLQSNAPDVEIDATNGRFYWGPDIGDAGTYYANFTVTDDDGLWDSENVTLTVKPYVPPPLKLDSGGIKRLATETERSGLISAGLTIAESEDIFFIDMDGDGDQDAIETTTGEIETSHNVDSLDILVLVDKQNNNMVVMDFDSGGASPVKKIAEVDTAIDVQKVKRDEDAKVSVTVPKENGWIHVAIDDPAPGQNITSLVRADGVVLELDQAWRTEDGKLHFIDDPDTTYTFGFEPLPNTSGKVWLWVLISVLGALVIAGGIWGGIYLYRRPELLDRFRKGAREEGVASDDEMDDNEEWDSIDPFDQNEGAVRSDGQQVP